MPNRFPFSRTLPGVGPTMNRHRVITLMTVAVFVTLTMLMVAVFDGVLPWPVLLWFGLSHIFFCVMIAKVRQFKGPYTPPMADPTIKDWAE